MADYDEDTQKDTKYKLSQPHTCSAVTSFMTEEVAKEAMEVAVVAVDKHKQLKDIAFEVKSTFDKKYPGTGKATEGVYHCIVGKNFASAVSHETRQFIHMKVDHYNIILWKSKDSRFHVQEQ